MQVNVDQLFNAQKKKTLKSSLYDLCTKLPTTNELEIYNSSIFCEDGLNFDLFFTQS